MGQCHYCRRVKNDPPNASAGAEGYFPAGGYGIKNSGSDSALDSDHSGDEGSFNGGLHSALRLTRSGHSSQSSGKYSLRESFSSCGELERHDCPSASANDDDDDEYDEDEGDTVHDSSMYDYQNQTSSEEVREGHLHPFNDASKWRKLSRGSNESEKGSMTSMSSLTSELKARLGRSISLKLQRSTPRGDGLASNSWKSSSSSPKKARSVSLRLPRKQKRSRHFRNKLPTIYVDDTEVPAKDSNGKPKLNRKLTLRRTFSLLNVSSLHRLESQKETKQQKPVQKILRQPRRRHNTVRGISGMAIDGANRTGIHGTRYYPTNTSLRVASPTNALYL